MIYVIKLTFIKAVSHSRDINNPWVRLNAGVVFRRKYRLSLFFHMVTIQPAWGLIAWTAFTGAGFVFSIVAASRKKIKEADKTPYNK